MSAPPTRARAARLPPDIETATFGKNTAAMNDTTPSVERVRAALVAAGHADTIGLFPEGTRTAQDAATAVGCTVAQIVKSIVLRTGDEVVLVLTSGANRVDTAKIAAALGSAVKPADGRWVRDVTGFAIGGVAPVGHAAKPRVFIDEDLMRLDPVWAAAGSPRHVFKTSAAELARMTGGPIADVKEG
jgi:prolyl-tRNA editing enzyme YbaK/EbsC (Cys-tRNA(Pro) deacylase)